jgi:hypothetical protein
MLKARNGISSHISSTLTENWSKITYECFWFNLSKTGEIFELYVYFGIVENVEVNFRFLLWYTTQRSLCRAIAPVSSCLRAGRQRAYQGLAAGMEAGGDAHMFHRALYSNRELARLKDGLLASSELVGPAAGIRAPHRCAGHAAKLFMFGPNKLLQPACASWSWLQI